MEKILSIISTTLLPIIFSVFLAFATKIYPLRKKYIKIELENDLLKKENKYLKEKLNEVITKLNKYEPQKTKIETI